MVLCRHCTAPVPLRSFLFSPVIAIADVWCPACGTVNRASPRLQRRIRGWLFIGGLGAAATALAAYRSGWTELESLALIPLVAAAVGAVLTLWTILADDFHA